MSLLEVDASLAACHIKPVLLSTALTLLHPRRFLSLLMACDSMCRGNVSRRHAGFTLAMMMIHTPNKQDSTIFLLVILHQTGFVITHHSQENEIPDPVSDQRLGGKHCRRILAISHNRDNNTSLSL